MLRLPNLFASPAPSPTSSVALVVPREDTPTSVAPTGTGSPSPTHSTTKSDSPQGGGGEVVPETLSFISNDSVNITEQWTSKMAAAKSSTSPTTVPEQQQQQPHDPNDATSELLSLVQNLHAPFMQHIWELSDQLNKDSQDLTNFCASVETRTQGLLNAMKQPVMPLYRNHVDNDGSSNGETKKRFRDTVADKW